MTKYFTRKELACQCGCGMFPGERLMVALEMIRHEFGAPIRVTSGARCSQHNRAIGGARNSAHVSGQAADLARTPELMAFLLANADRFNIWIEEPTKTPVHCHIQTRPCVGGRVFQP